MPASLEHELLVDLFRQHPNLVPGLLVTALGVAVPQDATVTVIESTLDELKLPELHADLVVEVRSRTKLVLAVVLEVQLANDTDKSFTWPVYVALVRARRRCRACVLVVAPDASVAAWAARPIELGPGSVVAPLVLGPERIPRVSDPDMARQDLPLAVLSARAHGNDPDGLPLLLASLTALEGLDPTTRDIYLFIIYDALRKPVRKALETAMNERFKGQIIPRPRSSRSGSSRPERRACFEASFRPTAISSRSCSPGRRPSPPSSVSASTRATTWRHWGGGSTGPWPELPRPRFSPRSRTARCAHRDGLPSSGRMRIGAYEVLGELGRGGMGVVYRVRAPDGGDAALKLLLKTDEAAFVRFERERRLLAALGEKEGFVQLLDAGVAGEAPWLVMPFVPGGTLRKKLESGPLGVQETIDLGKAIASALGAAHAKGIVHRDVKPENLLFTKERRVLVADLGLAKHFDPAARGGSQSVRLTRTGTFKGTAGYVAPEQVVDAAAAGPAADVFALGAVLYECLAGRPAFGGSTVIEVLTKLSSGIAEPIGRPDVPPWLEGVVRRSLALDPRERFPDGASLERALRGGAPEKRSKLVPLLVGAGLGAAVLAGLVALLDGTKPRASPPSPPVQARPKPPPVSPALPEKPTVPGRPTLSTQDFLDRATRCWQVDDWDGVIECMTGMIELEPGYAKAWVDRGGAKLRKGDLDGAIADETKAIELDPGRALAWSNRAFARRRKGDPEGAIADATKAIELAPGLAVAWRARGEARCDTPDLDLDGAVSDLTKAIEVDPTHAHTWAIRAGARSRKGDLDGAIADATKAIELDSRLADAWVNRGTARETKGDFDGAIEDSTKAIELDPGNANAWGSRSNARSRKGDFDGAIADATKVIELDPKRVTAWINRGNAREQKGDHGGAIADFERFLELAPDHVLAGRLRQELAGLKARSGR
jgi:serine/threonine protein kinase/tetratricopeptide (TPR) repeat protein